ncbi:MAG: pilus assembly protein [Bryobacteraceae bacterium]|nr:pilus assembly protein [Bryobacteraceae bacterium]
MIKTSNRRRRSQGGNTLVEFALCLAFLAPLLMGLFSIGMNLTRNMQVTQVSRSTGLMFVRQIDFSILQNQRLIVRLTEGLGMKLNANYDPDPNGRGVVIVSQVTIPSDSDCTGAGLTLGACTNRGVPVITYRLRFGNTALRTSDFGQPPSNLIGTDGSVSVNNYLTNTALRAANFGNVITLNADEIAYVTEVYFTSPDFDLPGWMSNTGVYSRSIY